MIYPNIPMVKKNHLLLLLLCLPGCALAFGDDWHRGVLTLKNDRVVQGELSVRTDCNVVIYKSGDAMMVYPAHKVARLSIFDTNENLKRTFVSVRKKVGASVVHELYEVVLDGDIAVLRKGKSVWHARLMDEDDFDYFAYYNNELVPLNKFRKKLFRKVRSRNLRQYVRKNDLNLYRLPDTVRIIDYLNRQDLVMEFASR